MAALENGLKSSDGKGLICEKVIVGKPNGAIIDLIMGQHNIPVEKKPKMVMIGDRANTDVSLAHNGGIDSVLVFSGVVKDEEDARAWASQDPKFVPTYVMQSFGESFERD